MNNASIPFLGIVLAAVLAVVTAAASSVVASRRANATRSAHVNATHSAGPNATHSTHVVSPDVPEYGGRVLDLPPPPGLEPPAGELKLEGSPRVEETDNESYKVFLPLSRELTAFEQDAAAVWAKPNAHPASWVRQELLGAIHVDRDARHLVVTDTTIEKVAEYSYLLVGIVSKIAAEGEQYRQRAVADKRKADEEHDARQAERARRRDAAKEIKFD